MTEDQSPTNGLTPTMAEQAIALERREKATVRPARASWIRVGDEYSLVLLLSLSCSADLFFVL